jgi:hypothetical protein
MSTAFIADTCIGAPPGCQARIAYASLNSEGAIANADSDVEGMSDDGRYIFYTTSATNLAPGLPTGSPNSPYVYGYAVLNPLQ